MEQRKKITGYEEELIKVEKWLANQSISKSGFYKRHRAVVQKELRKRRITPL
jgi:hypothetical protein